MSWFHKKKMTEILPELTPVTESKKKEPPFPVDKPNSCEFCTHKRWGYSGQYCEINNEEVYVVGDHLYRTWDKCDNYCPIQICKTCKHYSPTFITVMDEAFEDVRAGCTREGGYESCNKGLKDEHYTSCGWEAKE